MLIHFPHGTMCSISSKNSRFFVRTCDNSSLKADRLSCLSIPMCPSTFTYRFKLILKANNLPLDLNVHSLRHTNASLLISQGVDVRTVASLLGHAQASKTLDIYAHAFDKNKRKAQEKLGKAIGL